MVAEIDFRFTLNSRHAGGDVGFRSIFICYFPGAEVTVDAS
jgi:hypothetical protein